MSFLSCDLSWVSHGSLRKSDISEMNTSYVIVISYNKEKDNGTSYPMGIIFYSQSHSIFHEFCLLLAENMMGRMFNDCIPDNPVTNCQRYT